MKNNCPIKEGMKKRGGVNNREVPPPPPPPKSQGGYQGLSDLDRIVKEPIPVQQMTGPTGRIFNINPSSKSLKDKKSEIEKLIKEFQSELSSILQKKIGEELQLDSKISFGHDEFGDDVFVIIYLPNGEMSREDLDDYLISLEESDEFKDTGLIFYLYEVRGNKEENE